MICRNKFYSPIHFCISYQAANVICRNKFYSPIHFCISYQASNVICRNKFYSPIHFCISYQAANVICRNKFCSPIHFCISYQAGNVICRNKFLDYKKLIASFFAPLAHEYRKWMVASGTCLPTVLYYRKWMVASGTCLPTVLYYRKSVLNIVPSFVATIHLQDSVEQQFFGATKQKEPPPSTFHVFNTAQLQELNTSFALRFDNRYEIKQAVSERARGVGFVTVATFLTKTMCFVVISVDDFLHVRSVTRTVDNRTLNYHTVITEY